MINLLLMVHSGQYFIIHTCINPLDIPYFALAKIFHTPIEPLYTTYFLHNRIFGI